MTSRTTKKNIRNKFNSVELLVEIWALRVFFSNKKCHNDNPLAHEMFVYGKKNWLKKVEHGKPGLLK